EEAGDADVPQHRQRFADEEDGNQEHDRARDPCAAAQQPHQDAIGSGRPRHQVLPTIETKNWSFTMSCTSADREYSMNSFARPDGAPFVTRFNGRESGEL